MNDDYTVGYRKKGGFNTQEEAEASYYKYEEPYYYCLLTNMALYGIIKSV